MDQQTSLKELGLGPEASPEEIERSYKTRSRALKSLILSSRRAELKEQHRDELRHLVLCRATALGEPPPGDWHADQFRISSTRLLARLRETGLHDLNRRTAREFLGVPAKAKRKQVMRSYREHQRALIRRFARARDDSELAVIRRARGKLRTIRNFAL